MDRAAALWREIDKLWKGPEGIKPPSPFVATLEFTSRLRALLASGIAQMINDRRPEGPSARFGPAGLTVAQERVWSRLTRLSSDVEIDLAAMAVRDEYVAALKPTFHQLLIEQVHPVLEDRRTQFLKEHLEPCDLGACSIAFDYTLASISTTDLKTIVQKLSERPWKVLFPEEA